MFQVTKQTKTIISKEFKKREYTIIMLWKQLKNSFIQTLPKIWSEDVENVIYIKGPW